MKLFSLGLCFLIAASLHAFADIEITAGIRGFDVSKSVSLQPTEGPTDDSRKLPTVTTKERRTTIVRVVREVSSPAKFDKNGAPMSLKKDYVGVTMQITIFPATDGFAFRGHLTLAEQRGGYSSESVYAYPTLMSAKTNFRGVVKAGKLVTIPVLTPSGTTAKLNFRLTPR